MYLENTGTKTKATAASWGDPRLPAIYPLVVDHVKAAQAIIQAKTGKTIRVDQIILNGRLRQTMGFADIPVVRGKREYHLHISSKIFKKDSPTLRETVYHEVAHLADVQLFNTWGHGDGWKLMMETLGYPSARVHVREIDYRRVGYDYNPQWFA